APPKQPILIFELNYPRTKRLAFHIIIHTDHLPSKEILAQTSAFRDELYQALEDGSPSTVISACENYFPFLFGLVQSVQFNQNLQLNTPMTFTWTSPFVDKLKPYMSYTYQHEIIMVSLAYGLAHYNRGAEILRHTSTASFEEESKKAVLYFKTAAGILQYIHVVAIPKWIDIPVDRPPELHMNVMRALQDYCCYAAQSITIKKGITGLSKPLLAKLAVQNWQHAERFVVACRTTKNYKEMLPTPLKKFLPYLMSLSKATAHKFMALNAYSLQKYGAAASHTLVATEAIRKIKKKPVSSSIVKQFGQEINDSIMEIEHVHRKCFGENEHVYYQRTTPEDMLEMMEPKSVVTIAMWIPPPPAYDRIL
ncbi:hypothetical protein PROFUN_14808, partial [Planoprotostelium fungivorum]